MHEAREFSLAQASLVLSTVYFTFAVFRFCIGFIIDRTGLHVAKIAGVATYAFFPLAVYSLHSFPLLLFASAIWGMGAPMLWTGSLVQVMNTSPQTRYGAATGIVRGTVMLAVFLGTYLLSFIYARRGYEAVFLTAFVLGLVALLAMSFSPNRPVEHKKPELRRFFEIMRRRETRIVAVFLLCSGLGYGVILNGLKGHIEVLCGRYWLERILPLYSLAAIGSNYLGGHLCDRIGRWRTFGWGFALGAVAMAMGWAFTARGMLMGAMLLLGVQFAVVPLAAFAWIGDTTTPADRASVMGYIACFRDLGIALAIQLGGLLPNPRTNLLVFAVISAICAVVAFTVKSSTPAGDTA